MIQVLANDSDSDGTIDATSVTVVTDVQHGTTTVDAVTGEVTYVSDENYEGEDSFTYRVKDNAGAWSNSATVSIELLPPPNVPPVSIDIVISRKSVTREIKPTNWYIRLVAEDSLRALRTSSSQLGEMEEHSAVQKHTLKALKPFEGHYIDIVFRDPPGVTQGDYKVNFHHYDKTLEGRWIFMVRTNDASADITLSWRGIYLLTPYEDEQSRKRYKEHKSSTNPLIKNMKLIDSSNGKEIPAAVDGKVQSYRFNMDGQTERTFEWVVQVDEVDIDVSNKEMKFKKVRMVGAKESREVSFDLSKPPLFEENAR